MWTGERGARPGERWLFLGCGVVTGVTAAAWFVFLWYWGKAYDYADANLAVPDLIETAQDAAAVVGVVGIVVLVGLMIAVLVADQLRTQADRNGG